MTYTIHSVMLTDRYINVKKKKSFFVHMRDFRYELLTNLCLWIVNNKYTNTKLFNL